METAIDVANHLASGLALSHQDKASDLFNLLGKEALINPQLAKRLSKAVGLRTLIVHIYGEIDYQAVFKDYKSEVGDLREFAEEIPLFLQKLTR